MKNLILTLAFLIGISIFAIEPSSNVKAGISTCSISVQLTGTGSTSATVQARDEVNGTLYTLSHSGSGLYSLNGVNCEMYTISACASSSHGSVTHVNFNTTGNITMISGPCSED